VIKLKKSGIPIYMLEVMRRKFIERIGKIFATNPDLKGYSFQESTEDDFGTVLLYLFLGKDSIRIVGRLKIDLLAQKFIWSIYDIDLFKLSDKLNKEEPDYEIIYERIPKEEMGVEFL